jgi:hypothetical protein
MFIAASESPPGLKGLQRLREPRKLLRTVRAKSLEGLKRIHIVSKAWKAKEKA